MRAKPADLSAGLVAVKGAATPSPDMPGREGESAIAPIPAAPPPATARPARPAARRPLARLETKEPNLTPLNFRIPASFRREFRTYAATHDLKLNELLRLCFEAYRRHRGD